MAGAQVLVGVQLGFSTAAASYLLPGKNVDPTLVDGYPGSRNFKSGIVPFRAQYEAENSACIAWGHDNPSNAMREQLLLKTGWLDFKLEADGDIVSRLEKHRNDDAINQQRDWSNHMRAFLSKLIDHVIKRGKVTFGALGDVTYRIAIAVPPWWFGEVPPSILEPLEVSNGAKFKVEIIPEPVCVLSYFFSREKKHILSNTGAPSLVFHCGMDDRFTTITSIGLLAKGSSRDVRLNRVEIEGFSLHAISTTFREILQHRLESYLATLDEDLETINTKLQKMVDDFIKFLAKFDGTKDCKLRLPWKLPDDVDSGIKNNQITFESSILRERLFKKLLIPLSTSLSKTAETDVAQPHVLCSGLLSECPYTTICLQTILEEVNPERKFEILNTLNGETGAARGAAVFLDETRQHAQIAEVQGLQEDEKVVITMSSAIDVVETRINALLTENTENLQESEAKLLRFRTELLIHAHNKNFKPTSLLFELFAFSYKLRDFSDNEDSKTKLRQQFDSLLKVLCVSDSEAKEVDTAVYFYKHGATSELLTFLCATGSDLSQKVNIDGTSFTYPIHVAVKCGQLEVVKWMLLNGTKLDFQASDGSTCLHEAVRSVKDTEETSSVIFEILLKAVSEQGASKTHILDMEDHSGCTVLDLTKGSGRSKEQDMLRAAGAHENSKTLALRHQVVSDIEKNDHQHLEKVLGEHPELCDGTILSDGMTLLHLAVKQRSLDCANLLLCACTTPKELANTKDSLGWSSLHFSVAAGDLNITTLLLQHGADADTLSRDGCGRVNPRIEAGLKKYSFDLSPSPKEEKNGRWRPLHIASIIGSEAIARLLVESGAQLHPLDLEGLTPMRRAILLKYPAIVQLILESSDTSTTGSVGSTDTPSSRKMQPSQGALTDAVVMENDEIVNLLLDHGWNVNEQSAQTGWTALSQAVVLQNEKLVTRLLQKGADPSILHGDRSSLIHLAAEGKNIQLVRALLPRCSALVTDQYGATALHAAAKKGFSPTAKLLLKSGIDIDAVDQERKSALYIALESSNLPVAQFLLDNGASTQSFGGPQKTLMHAAVRSGNPWALKLVLSQKGMKDVPLDSTDENGDTLLCIAAKGGHAKMVQELMRLHRPRNLWRPILATLFKMAEIGNDAMLKVIIHHDKRFVSALNEDAGAVKIANVDGIGAVSKSSWTVLHAAVWYAQPSSAELLLVEGANIHAEAAGLTPLGLLCVTPNGQLQDAHLRVFAILLKNRADVLRGGLGHTALHLAAKAGHINLVERILSSGADLSATNGHGQTALQCAADSGHAEMVSHLVLKGAILDPICLHTAVHSGRSHTVEMLTDMGIDVNCVGPDGFTPLLVAAATGRVEMVNRLLEHGADIQFRSTNRKQSALDMAVASGQLGSVTALLDSPSYGKAFRADHGYAWTAASKDSSAGGKIYKYIFERTDCQKDHGAAILHWAIINDNELLLHLLINNGVDLKTPNLDGWGALHAATMAGKLDMMKLILSKGVGVNYQGHKSRTALHQAIAADQAAAYTFLMQNGADNSILDEDSQGCIRLALDYSATEVLAVLNLQPYHFTGNSYDGKTLVALAAESDNGSIISCLLKIEAGFSAEHTTSFAQAVSSGDELLVRRLLVFGAELNRKDFRGVSPLREAVTKQNQGIAELLLDSGADVESKCSLGMTPLAFAAKNNDSTMAALLIRYGANVNATETKNECPILVAVAWRGHLEVARLLLQHGCDVQCRTSGGSTALHQATTENHVELIKVLVQAGIQVDIKDGEGHSPLYLATEHHSDTAAAESLLHLGASTELKSASGYTPLMNATIKNQVALMRTLIEFGADINNPDEAGRVPIMVAVAAGSQPCIALLKDHGARLDLLDKSGHSLLHYVAESGNMDVIKTFIGNGLDINSATDKNGATLLHRAAGAGRLDLVKSLLDAGAILQSKTIDGETVLMTACCGSENANVELARYLIEAGQDVNAIGTGTRRTPLTNAVLAGNMEMTKMLIQKGANVKLSASGGQSLLHEAAASGSVALLDLLVSHGLSLNTVGNGPVRESVLFTAADSGQEEAVLAIAVQTPELIDKANASGETPLQRAVVKQHLGVVKLLCDLGAMVHQIKHDTRETLMHLASKTGKAASTGELIKYLSECGVSIYSPTNDGITPLMMAVMHEAAEAVAAILDCGAKVDEFDFVGGRRRVLDVAVRGGMCSMVQLLVSRGASLTFLDERGNPILDTAVTSNNAAIVKSILQGEQANFNINGISSDDGFGPLHKAAARNNGEVVSLLLEYGARGNLRTGDGRTALQLAAGFGHADAAAALYKSGKELDTDFRDRNGNTAMMLAARRGDADFIRNLMAHHEHLATPSAQWDEAASAAAESGHFEVVQLFIDTRDALGWQE